MSETDLDTYALKAPAAAEVAAPDLPYRPPLPRAYRPRIALVGAGGIAAAHLAAYRAAGFDVAVICNRTLARPRRGATSSSPAPRRPTTSPARSPATTSRSSTSPRTRPSGCR